MANIEKSAYGQTYIKQDDGSKVIPGTRRPDGTMRKEVRVKGDYVPQEEQARFVAGGTDGFIAKQKAQQASGYPPGYSPDPAPQTDRRIPGLPPDDGFSTQKKKGKKKKPAEEPAPAPEKAEEEDDWGAADDFGDAPKEPEKPKEEKKPQPKKEAKKEAPKPAAEPAEAGEQTTEKLLRKARKKLKEIEDLIAKKAGAELLPEEQAKVSRKGEFEAEIRYLEKVMNGQTVAPPIAAKKKAEAKAEPKKKAEAKAEPTASSPKPTKPASPALSPKSSVEIEAAQKRLRNVQKKLREIDQILEKAKSGALSKEQQEKVDRKTELEIEMRHLSSALPK